MKRFLSLMVAVVFAVTCLGAAVAAEQKAAPAAPEKAAPAADNTVKKPEAPPAPAAPKK